MSEKILLKTEAEIYENGWKKAHLSITESALILNKRKIEFKKINDVERTSFKGKDAIRIKWGKEEHLIHVPEKQSQIFRFIVYNLKSDKFAVYFLSPAIKGGVFVADAKWDKGYLSITESAIWFLSPSRQIRVPLNSLGSVKKDVRTVGKKERMVLAVTHVEEFDVITSFVLCPETTLEMLEDYLKRLIDKKKPKEKLSELEGQVLTLAYTGVNSAGIESILGITTDELNAIIDKLVEMSLARVVRVRKEIELTPRGVALVNEIMESGGVR